MEQMCVKALKEIGSGTYAEIGAIVNRDFGNELNHMQLARRKQKIWLLSLRRNITSSPLFYRPSDASKSWRLIENVDILFVEEGKKKKKKREKISLNYTF